MKENLLWERKIAFLNVAYKIPYLKGVTVPWDKILSWTRLGNYQMLTVKYFHFMLYLFIQNDEYADLKLNFFVPKRTMEPSSWRRLAFTDGPSDGMSHCTVNGQRVKYDLITSHTAEEDHLDWGLLWLCWWSPGIVQNFDLISLLWITFPSPWSSK